MEISFFTRPFTDKLCSKLQLEYFPEFLSRARGREDVVLGLPGYRQTKSYTCGLVSGLMVLHFLRPEAQAKTFYSFCQAHDDWGMSTKKVASALRQSEVAVSIQKNLSFDQIASFIEAGKPIITSIKRHAEIQHWIVIYGVNRKKKEVFIAGDKFWFSLFKTHHKWNSFRHRLPRGVDFLICWKK